MLRVAMALSRASAIAHGAAPAAAAGRAAPWLSRRAPSSPALSAARHFSGPAARRGSGGGAPPAAYAYDAAPADAAIEEIEFDAALALQASATIFGTLGRRPEVRYLQNGGKVATLGLALSARKDRADEATTWVDVEAWGPLAERAAAELDKGARVVAVGRLRVEDWTDREGRPRRAVKLVASALKRVRSLYAAGGGGGGGGAVGGGDAWAAAPPAAEPAWGPPAASAPAAPAAPPQAGGAPALAPGAAAAGTDEERWMAFFEDPGAWYDNRVGKSNPRAPDFKRREGGRDAPALWVDGRSTPAWVKQELAQLDASSREAPPF
jgi:single-strand DNA-binding protein